jgi:hypothetical protein
MIRLWTFPDAQSTNLIWWGISPDSAPRAIGLSSWHCFRSYIHHGVDFKKQHIVVFILESSLSSPHRVFSNSLVLGPGRHDSGSTVKYLSQLIQIDVQGNWNADL